jgi:hypothetical protein
MGNSVLIGSHQLCIHCRGNPAGFWVSPSGGGTRRPWCLSCCQDLDRGYCDIVPFGGGTRRGDRAQPRWRRQKAMGQIGQLRPR